MENFICCLRRKSLKTTLSSQVFQQYALILKTGSEVLDVVGIAVVSVRYSQNVTANQRQGSSVFTSWGKNNQQQVVMDS